MKLVKKFFFLLLIIACLLFLGYYRDFIFKNVNSLLKALDYETTFAMPPSLHFLENYTYATLLNIKWLLTLIFSFIYLIIALLTIQFIFPVKNTSKENKNKKYRQITIAFYIAITGVSGIFMVTGYLFPTTSEKMYEFARYLMGMAQSPIILMILIPAFKISENEIEKQGIEPNNHGK